MPIISGGNVTPGAYGDPYLFAGAPSAGTNEVQTLTIGGTPTGGTFKLNFDGAITSAITWVSNNTTLLASINAALDALPTSGTGGIVAAAGTLSSGIGTITLTFGANLARKVVTLMTVANNSLTGSSPTLAIAQTTPGVNATHRLAPIGALLIDTTNGILYQNSTAPPAPTWGKVGVES